MIRGGQPVAAVYRGGQSVKRVYRGDTEVWQSAMPSTGSVTVTVPANEYVDVFEYTIPEDGYYDVDAVISSDGATFGVAMFVSDYLTGEKQGTGSSPASFVLGAEFVTGDVIRLVVTSNTPADITVDYSIEPGVYVPPPRYTWTGTGSSSTPDRNVWTQVVSHTIPAGGSNGEYVADIIPYVQWRTPATNTTYQLRLLRDSVVIETETGYLDVFGSKYTSFTLSDQQVFAGQTYSVEILSGSYSSTGRGVMSTSLKFT